MNSDIVDTDSTGSGSEKNIAGKTICLFVVKSALKICQTLNLVNWKQYL